MKSFEELDLPLELQQALVELKFEVPTEIQKSVIPIIVKNVDLMGCAETGSGKTGAYGIPMVQRLLETPDKNALILAPTRELAHQIADFLRDLTKFCEKFYVTCLVGGADIRKQVKALKRGPRILVATPGRLNDHLRRKTVRLDRTEIIVLDEGDRMLDMGFSPQLDDILNYVPKKRQTLLFTATLPVSVKQLANKYLDNPTHIATSRPSQPVATVKQSIIQLSFKEKDDRIVDELNAREGSVMVFVRTKNRTNILAKILKDYGFKVGVIHGDRSYGQRNKAIQDFKSGRHRILCATDIAARGIDIPAVRHVINYDLPMLDEDYVHRVGRTARNGATGQAVSFVMPDEYQKWNGIVRKYKIKGMDIQTRGGSGGNKKKKRTTATGSRFAPSRKRDKDLEEFESIDRFGQPRRKKKTSTNSRFSAKKKNSGKKSTGKKKAAKKKSFGKKKTQGKSSGFNGRRR